jgi:hypothetical protein
MLVEITTWIDVVVVLNLEKKSFQRVIIVIVVAYTYISFHLSLFFSILSLIVWVSVEFNKIKSDLSLLFKPI